MKSAVEFWILAILVGMFQGGIQALSRSYYGKIIPKDHANEYYGFYDIFGKTASIIGTFLVATTILFVGMGYTRQRKWGEAVRVWVGILLDGSYIRAIPGDSSLRFRDLFRKALADGILQCVFL